MPTKFPKGAVPYFDIVNDFKGYRNREDPTNLDSGIMVHGSKNVLTNISDRIGNRPGYTLFGQRYGNDKSPVLGSYDLLDVPTTVTERHLKTFSTHIQVLWEGFDESSAPVWNTIKSNSLSAYWNFSNFWESDDQKQWILGVNGGTFLWAWNCAMAGFLSATATTITKQGTSTWEEDGFDVPVAYTASLAYVPSTTTVGATITDASLGFIDSGLQIGQKIVVTGTMSNNGTYTVAIVKAGVITLVQGENLISEGPVSSTLTYNPTFDLNGVTYSYTGGTSTTTLTGVAGAPVGVGGDMVVQTPQEFPLADFYGMSLLNASVIAVAASQLYLGGPDSNVIFLSKVDDFFDYTFSPDGRIASEGGQVNLDATPKGMAKQDGDIYVSNGKNEWNRIIFETSTVVNDDQNVVLQPVSVETIKTTTLQGAISQGAICAIENNLAFLSFSKQSLILGKTQFQEGEQTSFYMNDVMTELSAPVAYDFNDLDFTDATIFYDDSRKYTLHSFPKSATTMIYNNNTDQQYWEAPQNLVIGRYATIHGKLYGHGYLTPTTYEMFEGWNDDGAAIDAWALFSFQFFGKRVNMKHDLGTFLEGYIQSNTSLDFGTAYEQNGCGKTVFATIEGTDRQFVCLAGEHNYFGSFNHGKQGFGTVTPRGVGSQNLPPAFSIISTKGTPWDFRLSQFFLHSIGIDYQWQVVAFGKQVQASDKINVSITK